MFRKVFVPSTNKFKIKHGYLIIVLTDLAKHYTKTGRYNTFTLDSIGNTQSYFSIKDASNSRRVYNFGI